MAQPHQPTTVDGYLEGLPDDVRARMAEIRRLLRSAAPDVEETISYAMPTFTLDGRPVVPGDDVRSMVLGESGTTVTLGACWAG